MIIRKVTVNMSDKFLYVLGISLTGKVYTWDRTEGKWKLFREEK